MDTAKIRLLRREEIAPHIPLLVSEGFTPEIDQGWWLGGFVDGNLAGFVRVFDDSGALMLEDVYVFPQYRRQGLARTLIDTARRDLEHLWLICDDPMVGYYETLGFSLRPKDEFPPPLAVLYRDKKEWPEAPDHNHNAMRWARPRP
jgi:GNAT superfamily N-acetyltransferase